MRRSQRAKQRSEGTVLVEALIAGTVLAVTLGAIVFVHRYTLDQVLAFQNARSGVWQRAMTECNQSEPLFQDLASDLISGEVPFPDNLIPTPVGGSESFSAQGLLGRPMGGSKSANFICNPRPSQANPLAEPNEWVLDLFI